MSRISDIMTSNPACCTPETSLEEVAKLFIECDCGMLPVVDNKNNLNPIGAITDRDMVVRVLAKGTDLREATVRDAMTEHPYLIEEEASLDEALQEMESHQVRRLIIVDNNGKCKGILSQADIARKEPQRISEVLREVSQPSAI